MALLTVESMDMCVRESDFITKNGWAVAAWSTPSFDTGVNKCAGMALPIDSGGIGRYIEYLIPAASRHASCTIGYQWYAAASSQLTHRFYGDAGATEHIRIVHNNTDSRLDVYRGGVTLIASTANGTFPSGGWKYLEVECVLHDTTGRVKIWSDTVQVLDFTGDTKNGGAGTTIDYFIHGAANSLNLGKVDDHYALTGAGSAPTSRIGPIGVTSLRPTTDGFYSDWTSSDGGANADTINEYSTTNMPDVGLWNQTTTDNARDSFVMVATPAIARYREVVGVQWVAHANGGTTLTPFVRIGGTNYDGTAKTLTGGSRYHTQMYLTSPATGRAWTWGEIMAAEWGYKHEGAGVSCHVNQLAVEVAGTRRCGQWYVGEVGIG